MPAIVRVFLLLKSSFCLSKLLIVFSCKRFEALTVSFFFKHDKTLFLCRMSDVLLPYEVCAVLCVPCCCVLGTGVRLDQILTILFV